MRDRRPSCLLAVAAALGLATLVEAGCGRPAMAEELPESGYLRITAIAPGYPGRPAGDGDWLIYLDGFIDHGASLRLGRLLSSKGIEGATAYLNSPGGHLVEAMALGRLLRERRCDTDVGARAADTVAPAAGVCLSACPFAYAGGERRRLLPGSVLGVHRAANRVPVPDESAFQGLVAEQAAAYLAAMGVDPGLLGIMAVVPHHEIRVISPEEARRLSLVNAPVGSAAPERL